jgi:hypothetical protein
MVALLLGVCVAVTGCRGPDSETDEDATSQAQVQQRDAGDAHLTLTCDKSQAKVAEPIGLEFVVEHPPEFRVTWPPIEGDWGGFAVTPGTPETQKDEQLGTARTTKRYVLRALKSGAQTIPELTIGLVGAAPAEDGAEQTSEPIELVTRPIEVEITSVLAGDEEPDTVLQAEGLPVELPEERALPWKWLPVLLAGLALAGFVGYRLLRWLRDREPPPVVIPAHRWALDELDRLAGSDLIARGEVHEYYFRLSAILRGYLERRFGILAPEMTTEEFVEYMRADRVLSEEHRLSLGPFLEACDLVKFARHVPGQADVENAFSHARSFVIDTADYGASGAESPAGGSKPGREAAA